MGRVRRNTLATLGQIVAFIAGLFVIIAGVAMILEMLGDIPLLEDYPTTLDAAEEANRIAMGILAIVVGLIIIYLELDRIEIEAHLIRGIIYIVLGFVAFGGLLIIIAGILYILAEVIK
ncbi:MAG: hypothetical protein ACFFCQ_10900 [Promethearchaeota archaeon]